MPFALHFGGTLTGSTLTGATSVTSQAISVADWGGIVGHPGYRAVGTPLLGNPGSYFPRRLNYAARPLTLQITVTDRDSTGQITDPDGNCQHLGDNQDTLLGLLDGASAGGGGAPFLLTRTMPDNTQRYLEVICLGGGTFNQGPLFAAQAPLYTIVASCIAPFPLWRSISTYSQSITGTQNLTRQGGNAPILAASYVFGAAGTLTNSFYTNPGPDILTVTGACTVTTGPVRNVTVAGAFTPATDFWMWLQPATSVSLTSTGGAVTVQWRESYI